jgi:hypothetical protein
VLEAGDQAAAGGRDAGPLAALELDPVRRIGFLVDRHRRRAVGIRAQRGELRRRHLDGRHLE